MKEAQPTEAQEQANAAYVYRKHVQADLVQVMRDPQVKLQTAEWWFERYIAAYCRELAAHKAVDDEREQRKQAMAKPDLQRIHLMASLQGLSAWVDGKYLGTADVMGDRVTIEVSARQVERGPIATVGKTD